MTSIYAQALGSDFERLHPRIRERFGFSSADRVAHVGRGVMEEVWHGPPFTLPFLAVGSRRRIMFPSRGSGVPFTVENYAYVDSLGRETVTWIRTFGFRRRERRFDAYMIWSGRRGCIVDYLGSHQDLAVDIQLSVDPATRGLRLRSGSQRLYERCAGVHVPMALSGHADVLEWFDDERECLRIEVVVANPRFGRLFGYRGSFQVERRACDPPAVPEHVLPRREEARE